MQSTRPVWGATCQTHSDFVEPGISIHAPAWGATITNVDHTSQFCYFNPRARVGRDVLQAAQEVDCLNFNPRARVGRDYRRSKSTCAACHFNPRARVGRDKHRSPCRSRCRYFNPRARVGRDPARRWAGRRTAPFQSTRPRRARRLTTIMVDDEMHFNPRARVGRDSYAA